MAVATRKISLAKAMALKNRLAGRLKEVSADIQRNNSRLDGTTEQVNVRELLGIREQIVAALLELKTATARATVEKIDYDIRLLGEKKAELAFYRGITTTDGLQVNEYGSERDIKYVAVLKKKDVDAKVRQLEKDIDDIQDKLNECNYVTKIDIADSILNLGS